ncbi:PREDICTED: putative F-box protein At3g22650 [Camelina sativa]|uniref:F-box protein At3g22650 n=1 Tax=Camelina sativa TaxID=90675 RepID=A0ABM0T5C4_CAMSA|nr:PREDICTED: putative F-box protein At3g22650 [Camelina sativa]
MASSTERSSLLPIDIIEEIFCRTPVEYLTQFKLTCKQWHALLKDKRFIYKYLDRVQDQERFIRIEHNVQIIDPVNVARSSSPVPDVFHNLAQISAMVHCDGLLLCRCKNIGSISCKLAVWNPFLNRVKWIEPLDFYSSNDFYGIGYDNVCRGEYTVVRIFDGELDDESEITSSCEPKIQIYDFKSDSWRVLVDDTTLDWSIDPPCKGVSMKGNMYWIAHWNNRLETFIQSFDFSTETFKLVCDIPFRCGVLDTAALSSFRGERLSLLHQHGETLKIEVWVTNKLNDEVVSWTKYLDVSSPDLPTLHTDQDLAHPSYFIDKNDNIIVWCEEETEDETDDDVTVRVCKISKVGIVEKQVDVGRCDLGSDDKPFVCGYVYVPSLVPVPE